VTIIGPDGRILGPFVDTALEVLEGRRTSPEAREASTVMLLRDGTAGLEVHLLHRAKALAFAGGVHVFPGGSVDPEDAIEGLDPLAVAACRELWEEVGVLLGEGDRSGRRDRSSVTRWDTSAVLPWARWITPEVEVRRFDTWFWVAAMPADQRTADDDAGGEAQGASWVTPAVGLATMRLMPPQRALLHELMGYETVAEVLVAAQGREVVAILPKAVRLPEGEIRLALPGDPDYPS
jgi:8-oxo-dGTP pyrophosphatase MutT (NUDIX family)